MTTQVNCTYFFEASDTTTGPLRILNCSLDSLESQMNTGDWVRCFFIDVQATPDEFQELLSLQQHTYSVNRPHSHVLIYSDNENVASRKICGAYLTNIIAYQDMTPGNNGNYEVEMAWRFDGEIETIDIGPARRLRLKEILEPAKINWKYYGF